MMIGARVGSCAAAMTFVVVASNVLVQYPVHAAIGPVALADVLTYGAFTYPVAFLVTDVTNRWLGPARARVVVLAGFAVAVVLSMALATPRIAIASGSAFVVAQLLDVSVFNRLRRARWWIAPLVSSVVGSIVDTALFFSLAFAPAFGLIGPNDPFAAEWAPFLGAFAPDMPRWVSWACGDLAVKFLVVTALLLPFRLISGALPDVARPASAG